MSGGSKMWEDPLIGVPGHVLFECESNHARHNNYNTLFWHEMASRHHCWFDFRETYVPIFAGGLPGVATAVLSFCGGANHVMICDPDEVFWQKVKAASILLLAVIALGRCASGHAATHCGKRKLDASV
mmetsp:Transcript_61968/g.111146  ORF Transcript_61968/g.111146 Transcript_61968/m.111146 type:complete len:128 (+) Transcript_61968:159-542(+)